MRFILLVFVTVLVGCSASVSSRQPAQSNTTLDRSGYLYDPKDRSCDGFPRLRVDTMPGTCLGLVLPQSRVPGAEAKKSFIMPRTIAAIPGTKEFLLIDMGGWRANNGTLYWLKPDASGQYGLQAIKAGLNTPHGLGFGPDGLVYVGETQQVSRFRFQNGRVENWEVVVPNLPRFKGHMHPLTQFTFDPRNGDLFLNSGAPSDHCFRKDRGAYESCPEEGVQGLGAIYRIPGEKLKALPKGGVRVFEQTASGLRNSMAMVVHRSGMLVQGENSRDFPELEEPYEEINVIDLSRPGYHYGWPYCYNAHAVSPEWKFPENSASPLRRAFVKPVDCALSDPQEVGAYQPPHALMPPHVAPLHMNYYRGAALPGLKGQLLVSWHGYQPTGHRLVAYAVDDRGRPARRALASGETYAANTKGGCAARKPFKPAGGAPSVAPYTEVISGWNEIKGVRPKGAPVGFTEADDGSVWIVEDRENRTVLRLARFDGAAPSGCGDGGNTQQLADPRIELLAWRHQLMSNPGALAGYQRVRESLVQKYCVGCHGNFQETDIAKDRFSELDYFMKNGWIHPGRPAESKLFDAISQGGAVPPMPPGGTAQFFGTKEGDEILGATEAWIRSLPTGIEKTFQRTTMTETRKLRDRPNLESSTVCGRIDAGQTAYVDPRASAYVKESGWWWTKAYVLPGATSLFSGACPFPEDGVFWVSVRKAP